MYYNSCGAFLVCRATEFVFVYFNSVLLWLCVTEVDNEDVLHRVFVWLGFYVGFCHDKLV